MDRMGYTMLPVERIRQTEMTACDFWEVCPLRAYSEEMNIMLILLLNRY